MSTNNDLPYQDTVIIIPTYNEIDNVEKMAKAVFKVHKDLSILFVDDNSPDGTGKKIKELQKENKKIYLIERSGKNGLGTAYIEGFKWAMKRHFRFFFEMDCDFSHNPEDIPNLLLSAQRNDLAIGSRYIEGIRVINWPFKRLLLSYFASIYTRIITGMPIKDATGGYKCFTKKALESLNLDKVFSNGYSFQIELNFKVYSQGLKVQEVPIIFYERRDGQSKMSKSIVFEAVFAVFKLRIRRTLGILN